MSKVVSIEDGKARRFRILAKDGDSTVMEGEFFGARTEAEELVGLLRELFPHNDFTVEG